LRQFFLLLILGKALNRIRQGHRQGDRDLSVVFLDLEEVKEIVDEDAARELFPKNADRT